MARGRSSVRAPVFQIGDGGSSPLARSIAPPPRTHDMEAPDAEPRRLPPGEPADTPAPQPGRCDESPDSEDTAEERRRNAYRVA